MVRGPDFLRLPESEWPALAPDLEEIPVDDLEVKKVHVHRIISCVISNRFPIIVCKCPYLRFISSRYLVFCRFRSVIYVSFSFVL